MKRKRVEAATILLIGSITCFFGAAEGWADAEARDSVTVADMVGTPSEASSETDTATSSNAVLQNGKTERMPLQIPQKLQVVIDPFEIDGNGQVYSEEYLITNSGEKEGVLTLSFSCLPRENSGLVVRQEKEGLHEGEDKFVYMEILLKDMERLILSSESREYRVKLGPGEQLSLRFAGEVNENAEEEWKDSDIVVKGIYTWDMSEETLLDDSGSGEAEHTAAVRETDKRKTAGEIDLPESNTSAAEGGFTDKNSAEDEKKFHADEDI